MLDKILDHLCLSLDSGIVQSCVACGVLQVNIRQLHLSHIVAMRTEKLDNIERVQLFLDLTRRHQRSQVTLSGLALIHVCIIVQQVLQDGQVVLRCLVAFNGKQQRRSSLPIFELQCMVRIRLSAILH